MHSSWLLEFKSKLQASLKENDAGGNPLFIDALSWKTLHSRLPQYTSREHSADFWDHEDNWKTALKIGAYLNVPIIFGVPPMTPKYYGFAGYQNNATWLPSYKGVPCENYQGFLRLTDLDSAEFKFEPCK